MIYHRRSHDKTIRYRWNPRRLIFSALLRYHGNSRRHRYAAVIVDLTNGEMNPYAGHMRACYVHMHRAQGSLADPALEILVHYTPRLMSLRRLKEPRSRLWCRLSQFDSFNPEDVHFRITANQDFRPLDRSASYPSGLQNLGFSAFLERHGHFTKMLSRLSRLH